MPSDAHVIRRNKKNQKIAEIEENQLLTTEFSSEVTESVPTVTSDILTVLKDLNDDGDVLEGSGIEPGEITVTVRSLEGSEKFDGSERVLQKERQQRKKSLKSMEDSFERFYQRNRGKGRILEQLEKV